MKIIFQFIIILSSFWSIFAIADTSADLNKAIVVFGGGGEPKGETTIFDNTLVDLGKIYQLSMWKHKSLSFDSGHSVTESLVKENFSNSNNSPFTSLNFNLEVDKLKSLMEKKKTKQVFIYIDTHGEVKVGKELTHQISTIEPSGLVGLEKLEELSLLAKKNGILLAIVDQSCHSGNTLSLANDFTCVISATSPDLYSYGTEGSFAEVFLKSLKSGKNLEDTFLEARLDSGDPGFPMISSKENNLIKTLFYEKLVPYLYRDAHLNSYIENEVESLNSCARDQKHEELINLINQVENLKSVSIFTFMKILLNEYRDVMNEYISNEEFLSGEKFQEKRTISNKDGTYKDTLPLRQFLTADYDEAITIQKKLIETIKKDPNITEEKLKEERGYLDFFQIAKKKQTITNKKHPEFKIAFNKNKSLKERMNNFSASIANESKRIYNELYKAELSTRKKDEKNPCHDFVF